MHGVSSAIISEHGHRQTRRQGPFLTFSAFEAALTPMACALLFFRSLISRSSCGRGERQREETGVLREEGHMTARGMPASARAGADSTLIHEMRLCPSLLPAPSYPPLSCSPPGHSCVSTQEELDKTTDRPPKPPDAVGNGR